MPQHTLSMDSKGSASTAISAYQVIPILRVASVATAVAWYAKLGFKHNWTHRFGPTFPAFAEISNANMKLYLSEHTGDARPGTLLFLHVPDVDAFVAELEGVMPENSTELGLRDCEVQDPDGNRLRIGSEIGKGRGFKLEDS